jgi:phosphoglycerate dehydrogenase-like enzyme
VIGFVVLERWADGVRCHRQTRVGQRSRLSGIGLVSAAVRLDAGKQLWGLVIRVYPGQCLSADRPTLPTYNASQHVGELTASYTGWAVKSIVLAKTEDKMRQVYRGVVLDRLEAQTGITAGSFFTEKELSRRAGELNDTQYIFSTWVMPKLSEKYIRKNLPNLRAVFYAAGSVKYFAEPFIACGVRIYSAASANAIPVAEFVTAQIILANKGYFQGQLKYKGRHFKASRRLVELHTGNYQSKVGIVGAGAVGTKIIELLKPYGIQVLVYDPYLDDERASRLGCHKVSLETVFEECQVVSNHLPDIESTKDMLGYAMFSKMQDAATFINTGRGPQVDERALVRTLRERPYMCALLDVTRREPLWPHSPFYRLKNVFITPHIAGSIGNEQSRMAEYMLEAFEKFESNEKSEHEVTRDMLGTMA